jgi:hypothetical protein
LPHVGAAVQHAPVHEELDGADPDPGVAGPRRSAPAVGAGKPVQALEDLVQGSVGIEAPGDIDPAGELAGFLEVEEEVKVFARRIPVGDAGNALGIIEREEVPAARPPDPSSISGILRRAVALDPRSIPVGRPVEGSLTTMPYEGLGVSLVIPAISSPFVLTRPDGPA